MGNRVWLLACAMVVATAAGCVGAEMPEKGTQRATGSDAVKTEKYTWDSVTIKANGFIDGIVFSRARKGLVYMHTDMGGAYRYDADEKKWVCLTDWVQWNDGSLCNMGVETLAADPTDAGRVYFGCGTYMGKSAILRSTDEGRTLQRSDVPFAMNGNGSARNAGERMNVDPNRTNILLYGTRNMGLWRSEDYAATWRRVESFPTIGDVSGVGKDTGIVWTLFDKASGSAGEATRTIYAGVCTVEQNKVFRSVDGGATWSPIPGQPGGKLLPTRVAMTPDGKTLYLTYVVGEGFPGPHSVVGGAIYRCDNPGSDVPVWTDISPMAGRFGWSGISLDPTDPQSLLVSVLCRYNPTDDIYRTTDGGKTWKPLNVDKNRDDSSAAYAKFMGTHWVGDVQIDPFDANRAMYTTGYGLYNTTNATSAKPTWAFFNEGFEQSAVLELVSPPSGSAHLLSAIGDRDGYRHEDFRVSPVHGQFGGEQKRGMGSCNDIDVAWSDVNVVVRSASRAQYSFDGGITWDWFADPPAAAATVSATTQGRRFRRQGVNVAVSMDGSRVVLSSGSGTFYATRNGAAWGEWRSSKGGVSGANVTSDLKNPKRFYARAGNSFYASEDAGASWALQTNQLPQFGWIRPVIGQEGHLYASARQAGLFRSTDAGKTWTNLPSVTVANQVGVGAAPPGRDYPAIFIGGTVGGLNGFFRSDDQGATWVRINDDQHHYGWVTVIQGDSRVFGRLYVGSNGRGILYGERQ